MSSRCAVALSFAILAVGCGASDSGTSPTPTPPGSTLTITPTGVAPKTITVSVGSQVTFVNSDAVSHQMYSDPHPEHTDCPEINQVGFLSPGEARQTGNLTIARTCGFHDHNQPLNRSLQGNIVIR